MADPRNIGITPARLTSLVIHTQSIINHEIPAETIKLTIFTNKENN